MASSSPIIFFDGVCNFCNGAVQYVIEHDPNGYFRFASLQSDLAKELLPNHNIQPDHLESLVLYEEGQVKTQSDAVLEMAKHMQGFTSSLVRMGVIFPKFIRDWIYNIVAKNRYAWFGKKDHCMVPTKDLASRFL